MNDQKLIKTVFICSPLRPVEPYTFADNLALVADLSLAAVRAGVAPFAPHLFYTQFLDDKLEADRAAGINCGLAWLARADEIWVYAESIYECSVGMRLEIEWSRSLPTAPPVIFMPKEFRGVKRRASGGPGLGGKS